MFTLSPSVPHRPSPSFCRVTTAKVKLAGGFLRSRTGLTKGATLQACCRETSDLSLLLKSNSILLGFVLFSLCTRSLAENWFHLFVSSHTSIYLSV